MPTQKPSRPICEKGVHSLPRPWWKKDCDANGDFGVMLMTLMLAPVVLPYMYVTSALKNLRKKLNGNR